MTTSCRLCGGVTIDQPANTPTTTTYQLPVSCPRCGGHLEHVTGSLAAGTETSAVCRCDQCGRGWQVLVHLRPVTSPASQMRAGLRSTKRGAA